MNRTFALPIALAAFAAAFAASPLPAQEEAQFLKTPYLQNVQPDGMTIMWETGVPCDSIVRYGQMELLGKSVSDDTPKTIHEVKIDGLSRETLYHYQIETCGIKSKASTFKTAIKEDTPFSFAVWGDNRTDFGTHAKVANGIARSKPDIAINVGDVVTNGEVYEQWGREYFAPISVFSHNTPTVIAIGNHEKNADWFYKFVSQPEPENYYAFTFGNARFLIIDSNQPLVVGTRQYTWLKNELKSDEYRKAKWHFAFFHHPLYSEGWDAPGYDGEAGLRIYLEPLFRKARMDMAFQGHTHDYERGRLDGVNYIISGGGGSALDVFQQNFDHVTVFHSRYQYCTVKIDGDRALFQAHDYMTDEVFDSLEMTKKGFERHEVVAAPQESAAE